MAELKLQLSSYKCERKKKSELKPEESPKMTPPKVKLQAQQVSSDLQSKPWFCSQCVEDGHIAKTCEGSVNKTLVDQKYKERKARQDKWKFKQGMLLNWTGSR